MVIITPNNDSRPHDEESTVCDCDPHVHFDKDSGEMNIYHYAFDGREQRPWPEVIAENEVQRSLQ